MSIFDRFLGLLAALAYGLHRAKIGFLRLRVGVMALCCLYAAHAAYRGWRAGFALAHGAVIVLCLSLATVLLWADRRRYIVFREQPAVPTVDDSIADHDLGSLRASRLHACSRGTASHAATRAANGMP